MHLSASRMRPIVAPKRARSALRRRGRTADRPRVPWQLAAATAGSVAVGALLEYFLDPGAGRRRRHVARDRALSRMRRSERRIVTRARRAESHALGVARRTINARRPRDERLDDVTLAHKVESELYRRAGARKGRISINAEDGVVFLRGALEHQEDIQRLGQTAREIAGVREVENLLHVPGTPAPASRSKLERRRSSE
jgi:hypothetical protein